jgi:hypothetical protein
MPPRPLHFLAPLALALLLFACFEPPITETLRLRFLPNGAVVVTSTVEITAREAEKNPALERRIAQTRQAVLEGWDPWSQRFATLEPAAERYAWEKRLGELHKGTRAALVIEPESLRRFFNDTSLNVTYEIRGDVAELVLVPGAPSRATRRQRQEMQHTLDEWTGRIAEYLAAAEDLYRYLDDRPDRARACFGTLFKDVLPDGTETGELFDQEQERVKKLQDAMEKVTDILLVPKGSDHSPDEISHLVYDPFPALLTVRLPSAPLDVPEGFEVSKDKEGELTAIGPGLWQALRSLEGRWLSPDPVLIYIAHSRSGEPFDLDTFLTQQRRASETPTGREVKLAVEERLRVEPVYRVTWKVKVPAEEEDEEGFEGFEWEG